MVFGGKSVSDLQEDDVLRLDEPEGKTIDYKGGLPGTTPQEKNEFRADVCSFANTAGGYLLYGVRETGGRPDNFTGCSGDADAQMQRLESLARDGIEPRIPGLQCHPIRLASGNWILAVYIPRSWVAPHIVKDTSRFHARNSSGKYSMDYQQIKSAFGLSETLQGRVRAFRFDRLAKIEAGESPVALAQEPKVIAHILPMAAFWTTSSIDCQAAMSSQQWKSLAPKGSHWNRHNFDGIISYVSGANGVQDYVQLFRDGVVEKADARILRRDTNGSRLIQSSWIEALSIEFFSRVWPSSSIWR